MNVLILHAHPESKSFTSALKDVAVAHFKSLGHDIDLRDLYLMKFNPIAGEHDFKSIQNLDYLNVMKEQMGAQLSHTFADDVQAEIEALEKADFILLNFPLWWSSFPAILKGWFDRVLAFGRAYHPRSMKYDSGAFKGKTAMCCICVGGSENAYSGHGEHIGLTTLLEAIHHQVLFYTGMTVLPHFVAWQPHLSDEAILKGYLESYKNHLKNLDKLTPIYQPETKTEFKES